MNYDPAIDKTNRDAGVVSAQPVSAYEVRTVAAAPAAHHVLPQYQAQGRATAVRPMQTHWRDSICDWPSNLFPSCYCVCCCCYGMWLLAQIAQKVQYSNFGTVIGTFVIIWIVSFILTGIFGGVYFVILMPLLFAFFFSIGLRLHVANRDNIRDYSGCLGEFCCGFWCWYCSVTQMARHVYGYTKVLDGDGDPDRPDNYAPIQTV